MNKPMIKSFWILSFLLCSTFSSAQSISKKDYDRAVSFMWNNINNKTAFNLEVKPNWFNDATGFWYVIHNKEGKTYMQYIFSQKRKSQLFNHSLVAQNLSELTSEKIKESNINLNELEYLSKNEFKFSVKKRWFKLNSKTSELTEFQPKNNIKNPFEAKSPDGNWIAFEKDYNLYVKETKGNDIFQLSTNGEKGYEYASYYGWYDKMEDENGERPKRFYVSWSPDSKFLTTTIVDYKNAEKMYLLDFSIDSLYKPKLLSYYRGSPGDSNMVHYIPVFYSIETKKEIKTDLPRNTHINSVAITWGKNSGQLFAKYPERGYQKEYLKLLNLNSNTSTDLIIETSETNIDNFEYKKIENTDYIVFTSERSGWKQLHSYNLKTTETKQLTEGNYFVNDIKYIDKNLIYFTASGREKGSNPYHQKLYKVNLKGKVTLLTPEDFHHIIDISKNGKYFVDNYSSARTPTKTILRNLKTGKIIVKISEANIAKLEAKNWKAPQTFQTIGRDGKTPIYGALWKPTNFDASKKYPIIDHSYTGPHTQMFPKDFRRVLSIGNQALAELGFIVIMVDGMGSTNRSKEFRNVSYQNMNKNLLGHKLAIEQLAKKYSWIDTTKVGIFGHSAGGYDAAHGLLEFPDFYKVGVSSSADHDFRMEKAWWPEMYMGWPITEKYSEVSNITMAGNLKGKLLLVHGGIDDNVNPSATFKLAEALIKNDKEFDLLIIPSQRHGYTGKYRNYFIKKRWNYFVQHLLNQKPIWNFSLE
jgi:dipeptidyl aminopeptidase/acylaminoacyl peptidase